MGGERSSWTAVAWSRRMWIGLWVLCILLMQTGPASTLAHNVLGWASGLSSKDGPLLHFVFQKGFHIFVFGAFGWLLPLPRNRRAWGICLLLCLAVSAGGELLQLFAQGRTPRLFDAVLNLTAATTVLWWRWGRRSPNRA